VGKNRVAYQRRGQNDCGITSVANAVSVPYNTVKRKYGEFKPNLVGMSFHELETLAGKFGRWKRTIPRRKSSIEAWLKRHPKGRYVILVPCPVTPTNQHAIGVVDGKTKGEWSKTESVLRYYKLVGAAPSKAACNRS
jgi:hypothetical protein